MNLRRISNPLTRCLVVGLMLFAFARCAIGGEPASGGYLSDQPELVLVTGQAWGELGWDVAAHAPGQAGLPLRIGEKSYRKGLGHHANGTIELLLDGGFSEFNAEVGLQPCGGGGSVIFRIYVDGEKRFDSGILRASNAPKPVRVDLAGAEELRLEADDAGDGIACDMANWADARLTPAPSRPRAEPETRVDVARFARVVTWDPHRLDGARASRIEEFRAEDVFTETDLKKSAKGTYTVPVSTNGLAAVGLQWLNRRALKELAIEFAPASDIPATNSVQVQGWFGESTWQGRWQALAGGFEEVGQRLVFRLSPKAGIVQTQKIRWVFPAAGKSLVRSLTAFTRSRWQTARLLVETERPSVRGRGDVAVVNGELLSSGSNGNNEARRGDQLEWNLNHPLELTVRSSRPSPFKSDPTVLQFHLPGGSVGVAVEDVLSNDCVYLPDHGLFVARDPAPLKLAEYKRKIANRKTVLQQVRELPDQTLDQALAKTHHEVQREGPVMLSLACDNTKFVLERDGTLRFPAATNTPDWFAAAGEIHPQFGDGPAAKLSRALDGGWLPMPVITVEQGGFVWRERVFVAPADDPGSDPARLNRPFVCVLEFTVTNTQSVPAQPLLTLTLLANSRQKQPAPLPAELRTVFRLANSGLNGMIVVSKSSPLQVQTGDGKATFTGPLPPGGNAHLTVCLADPRVDLTALRPGVNHLREEAQAYWNAVLAPAVQVSTPDPLLNDLIRSSQVRCLIAARNEAGGARVAPWIAAMSYGPLESEAHSVIRGMAFMGQEDFARRGLDFFIHRYNTNGFLTTGYTTFGTAWHLWTLGEYYRLYRDPDWLRQVAPEVKRVGDWVVRQTEKTRRSAAPESGLMPPGVLADWNAFAYHFAMSGYYYAGLREIGAALDQRRFTLAAAELRANLLRAYRWTQSQSPALALRNGTWIPHYPSQVHSPGKLADFFPGQDAGRSWCYDVELGAHQLVPTGVLDPRDPEVERMLNHMEDVQFLSDGWFDYPAAMNQQDRFNLGGFSKVQPYYTRNCEIYALRDDVKPFVRSYFNTLAAMLNPEVLTFWEHFHHSGAWDKTHETGYFLHQTRTMLVTERGDQLWLAPLITSNWLKEGMTVAVSNAPTRFGPVSYRLESQVAQGFIEAWIAAPTRNPPKELVLRLRHPEGKKIRSVMVNDRPSRALDPERECIKLKPGRSAILVRVKYGDGPRSQLP